MGYCSIDILELTDLENKKVGKWFIGSLPGVDAFERVTRVIKIQVTSQMYFMRRKT